MTEGEPRVYDYVPLDELLEYLARHGLALVRKSLKWGLLRGPIMRAEPCVLGHCTVPFVLGPKDPGRSSTVPQDQGLEVVRPGALVLSDQDRVQDMCKDRARELSQESVRLTGHRVRREATALQVIDMALTEEKLPQVTTSFTVRDRVYTTTGKALPIDEVVAGGIVLVDQFRSRKATLSLNDFRSQWSSFQLVGVEIDEDAGTARLIPAGDRRGFEQFLTRLSELQRGSR